MFLLRLSTATLAACLLLAGCAKPDPAPHTSAPPAHHEHHTPHGGTPVELGEEQYHLEVVLDRGVGRVSAYVLDGEMEEFIRIAQPSLELVVTAGAEKKTLTLAAVANSATGETVGNTAQFEAQADWLKTTRTFDAVLTRIEVRGTVFTAVAVKAKSE